MGLTCNLAGFFPFIHQCSNLLGVIPDSRLCIVFSEHSFHEFIVDGIKFFAMTPGLAQRAAPRDIDNANRHLEVTMQEGAVKIGHSRKALGTLWGAFLPAGIFTDIRQRLIPGILPGNVAQTWEIC